MDGNKWGYSSLLAQTSSGKAGLLGRLHIERRGGLGFFDRSPLVSESDLELEALPSAEREAVLNLFNNKKYAPPPPGEPEPIIPSGGASHPYTYILTLPQGKGPPQTIVVPESDAPAVVRGSAFKDHFKS
jgi:hypothetical protein